MNKRERVAAALAGRPVDRLPVSAWRHFVEHEQRAPSLADAMLGFHREYDWDFMKVNPRATYFAEAWGNRYDSSRYISVLPTPTRVALASTADLAKIRPVDPAGGPFGEQVEVVERINRGLDGEAPFVQTVFSPLSIVGFLTGGPGGFSVPGLVDALPLIRRFMAEDPAALEGALEAIAATLAEYVRATTQAGADGIFFAIVRLARDGSLTREEYQRFGRPYDLRVLSAAADASFNVLHVCGDHIYFDEVADYPAQAINWNNQSPGNPSIAEAHSRTRAALLGGVAEDSTLLTGTPDDVVAAVKRAAEDAGGRRLLIGPGCGVDPSTPKRNLLALRDAARSAPLSP